MTARPRVLAVAPYCDGTDVGEAWCAYMWVRELSRHADITLITQARPGRTPLSDQLAGVRVIARPEPGWALRMERLNAMAKLSYPGFYRWAKRQARDLLRSGPGFDIGHQFSPIALRFPSPLAGLGLPYVLGPLGGSLSTPDAFRGECESAAWYTRLRGLDTWRLKWDPVLKASYRGAAAVLGVAPYVRDLIGGDSLTRFTVMSELGVEQLQPARRDGKPARQGLRLLHVGRGVRTKGLRDCVRALARLRDIPGLHLDVAGKGEEMPICQALARALNVDHMITFHGQISRAEVDRLYRQADIFCFPSFREPSGSVIFEALGFGLPVIAADRGGPGHVIDDSCGVKIPVTDPDTYAADIAAAVRTLAGDAALRRRMADGAIRKMAAVGLWPAKIAALLDLYRDIAAQNPERDTTHKGDMGPKGKETHTSWPHTPETPKSLPSHPVVDTGSSFCA